MATHSPHIYLFYCANGYDGSALAHSCSHLPEMTVISLPCSGKLDILYLTKAFDTGADGAVILVCKEGECRYLEGNLRARKRAEAVNTLLLEAGLCSERIAVIQLDDQGIPAVVDALTAFQHKIADMAAGIS